MTDIELAVLGRIDDFIVEELCRWDNWDGEDPEEFGFEGENAFDDLMGAVGNITDRVKVALKHD